MAGRIEGTTEEHKEQRNGNGKRAAGVLEDENMQLQSRRGFSTCPAAPNACKSLHHSEDVKQLRKQLRNVQVEHSREHLETKTAQLEVATLQARNAELLRDLESAQDERDTLVADHAMLEAQGAQQAVELAAAIQAREDVQQRLTESLQQLEAANSEKVALEDQLKTQRQAIMQVIGVCDEPGPSPTAEEYDGASGQMLAAAPPDTPAAPPVAAPTVARASAASAAAPGAYATARVPTCNGNQPHQAHEGAPPVLEVPVLPRNEGQGRDEGRTSHDAAHNQGSKTSALLRSEKLHHGGRAMHHKHSTVHERRHEPLCQKDQEWDEEEEEWEHDWKKRPAKKAAVKPKAKAAKEFEPAKRSKKHRDPNVPKRAAPAFLHFSSAKRSEVKEKNPGIAFGEVGKKLGEMYKALSYDDRAPYERLAAIDKDRFEKEKAEYEKKRQRIS